MYCSTLDFHEEIQAKLGKHEKHNKNCLHCSSKWVVISSRNAFLFCSGKREINTKASSFPLHGQVFVACNTHQNSYNLQRSTLWNILRHYYAGVAALDGEAMLVP